jgi:hypothetical protein
MPRLGLRFSKLDVIPAAGASSQMDVQGFQRLGFKVLAEAQVTIMKCPIGDAAYGEQVVGKRVAKSVDILTKIQELPDVHCALHLLRYQTGRMDYITRTTPAPLCHRALGNFDSAVRYAFEGIVGFGCTDSQWRQAVLPCRYSGLGLRSSSFHADPSYVASRAAVHEWCRAIWTGWSLSSRDELHAAVVRINSKLQPEDHLTVAGNFDDVPSQRTLSDNLSK